MSGILDRLRPPNPPPPQPRLRSLGTHLRNADGYGIPGLQAVLIPDTGIPIDSTSDENGRVVFQTAATGGAWLEISDPLEPARYAPKRERRIMPPTDADDGPDWPLYTTLERIHTPFRIAPRYWRGNMCGVRVPGLPAVPGGSTDTSLVLSWFYDRYNDRDRARIRATWASRGYTHVLLSWPDSRGFGRTPEQFRDTCQELVDAGFYPCPMFYSKDYDPPDVPTIRGRIAAVLPFLIGVIPLACVGFELSIALSPTQVQQLIDWLAPQLTPTGCRVYVHFQQGYGSFQQPGEFVHHFWNRNVDLLTGVLHQKILTQNEAEYRDGSGGLVDMLQRFAGNFGVTADSGFGHPFDLVALEITASPQFEGAMNEAEGDRWGRWAIETPAQSGRAGMVAVMGSGNGAGAVASEINPTTDMQKDYVVLAQHEREQGFIQPVRHQYTHLTCGQSTWMDQPLTGTFCATCRQQFPLEQFVWSGTTERLD